MILREVRCKWASVIEPNKRFDPPKWEIMAILDDAQAAELAAHNFKIKTDDNGDKYYRFRRKCTGRKKTGDTFDKKPPLVIGANKEPFTELIGNGSLVNIQYNPITTEFAGSTFHNGDLCGIQVIEHVAFGDSIGDEFEDEGETKSIEEASDEFNEESPY